MRECGVEDFTICSGTGFRIKCIPVASENTSALVKHDIFLSAGFFQNIIELFIVNPHGFNCGKAGQCGGENFRWKNCGKHPKHCNLMVLSLKNSSQDTFWH